MPRVEPIDERNPSPHLLREASEVIAGGGEGVCPTDTGYAFSANAIEPEAIERVFALKGRSYSNPIHVAVNSLEKAGEYAHLNPAAERLAARFLPGALTLVLPRKEIIPALLVGGRDTVGIRIPDNQVMLALATLTGLPLTATSANISGQPTPHQAQEVVAQLGEAMAGVALVLDQGLIPSDGLSTIVDLSVSPPQILRQGLIRREEIEQATENREI